MMKIDDDIIFNPYNLKCVFSIINNEEVFIEHVQRYDKLHRNRKFTFLSTRKLTRIKYLSRQFWRGLYNKKNANKRCN